MSLAAQTVGLKPNYVAIMKSNLDNLWFKGLS